MLKHFVYKSASLKKTIAILFFLILGTIFNFSPIFGQNVLLKSLKFNYLHNFQTFIENLKITSKKVEKGDFKTIKSDYQKLRFQYKKIEQFIEYYDSIEVKYYINGAPLSKTEDEANYPTLLPPLGLQIIEELIYEDDFDKKQVQSLFIKLIEKVEPVFYNLEQKQFSTLHLLESSRNELIRIITLGLTGFDTPASGNAFKENIICLETLNSNLEFIKPELQNINKWDIINKTLIKAVNFINENNNFDEFNHVFFFKNYFKPLYKEIYEAHNLLCISIIDDFTDLPQAINYHDTVFYSEKFFNTNYYADTHKRDISKKRANLGYLLFNETALSLNQEGSCATCHHPNKAFTDGLATSTSVNSNQQVLRNSPTTINSVFAERFFWDMRAKSLHKQIEAVIINKEEFKINFSIISERLKQDSSYVKSFDNAYPKVGINHWSIKNAITNYLIYQTSYNSPFDKFMRNEGELSEKAQLGYNLFMGKAACATCHFPPSFSGLVPPLYIENESEVLGITIKNLEHKANLDVDIGRYNNGISKDHFDNYKNSFKTPSLRNVAITKPYMHNGVYKNLQEVMEFYNNGGGIGLGLNLKHQTLPSDSLNLSQNEIEAIIEFMENLTDYKRFIKQY